ncbi:MAG: type II toxin-antitoxin system RelB/DinJ family antitoxin [Spirochaetota bacterium]|jgi:DNA-damage-inducible protein J|nr:type II toxin-antitoxin system RelB/DinJ family antitoxin [Spirochaetota bacterium]
MKTAVLQTRVSEELKKQADSFFESIGLDTTTAIRLFLKQAIIQRKIPFEIIQEDTFYSEKNQKALLHSLHQMENGQHSIHELVEVDDE